MRNSIFLLLAAFFLSVVGCSDYISSKREGLKPYDLDSVEEQEQEKEDNSKPKKDAQ